MQPEAPRPVEAGRPSAGTLVRVVSELQELDALEHAWMTLAGPTASPMQQHAWVRACHQTFGVNRELHVIVVDGPRELRAIAPMVRRVDGLGQLEAVELDEPADVLAADMSSLETLASALYDSGSPLFLRRVLADSAMLAALKRVYQGRGLVLCRRQIGCPWVRLDPSWTEPERTLNAGRRSDLRRARRIAENIGPVKAEVLSPSPADVSPLLASAFEVEAAGWKGRNRTALVYDSLRQTFFRRYATAAARHGWLRLCFLRVGERVAAMQLAVEYGGRFWLLKIGYDETFARCSPGTLLMVETLRYAAERGLASYELLGCVEPWTRIWTDLERPCLSVRAYPATARGLAAVTTDVATMGWRRLGRLMRDLDDERTAARRIACVLGAAR